MIQRIACMFFGLFFLASLVACVPSQKIETPVAKIPVAKVEVKTSPPELVIPSVAVAGQYISYSESAYSESATKKRVLFFHAPWCPYCKAADQAFNANLDRIPADVVLLKTDYDTQKSLKTKYGVTYQHTFVYVDAAGNPVKIWNGGDINELITNTK